MVGEVVQNGLVHKGSEAGIVSTESALVSRELTFRLRGLLLGIFGEGSVEQIKAAEIRRQLAEVEAVGGLRERKIIINSHHLRPGSSEQEQVAFLLKTAARRLGNSTTLSLNPLDIPSNLQIFEDPVTSINYALRDCQSSGGDILQPCCLVIHDPRYSTIIY